MAREKHISHAIANAVSNQQSSLAEDTSQNCYS